VALDSLIARLLEAWAGGLFRMKEKERCRQYKKAFWPLERKFDPFDSFLINRFDGKGPRIKMYCLSFTRKGLRKF